MGQEIPPSGFPEGGISCPFFLTSLGRDATSALSCGIIDAMDARDLPGLPGQRAMEGVVPGRLIGLQGRLARPFWGVMGIWAVLCGALASNRLRWDGRDLLTLALVLILADLAWGSLWDLVVGTDWRRLLTARWSSARPTSSSSEGDDGQFWKNSTLAALPYTQPGSPGGRVSRRLSGLVGWWCEAFWPAVGPVVLGSLGAVALTVVLTCFLADRVRPLNAVLAVIVGLGLVQRWRGRSSLAGQALVQVGLSWLVGHAAFAGLSRPSVILAVCFAVAAWGVLRAAEALPRGLWLLDGGQAIGVALLAVLRQPLAAGAMGMLLFGQVALQPSLGSGIDPARVMQRTWPWLMAAMLVAALAVP